VSAQVRTPLGAPRSAPVVVRLGVMPEVIRCGVRSMLTAYADRVALRDEDEPRRVSDLCLVDPYTEEQAFGAAFQESSGDAGPLAFYTCVPMADRAELSSAVTAFPGRFRGWLCMRRPAGSLVSGLERIHRGEIVIDEQPRPEHHDHPAAAGPGLCSRELEILTLVASGLSNHQIAAHTYLSINSVKSYIRTAYRKIGAHSRSEAVLWGVEHGLVQRCPGDDTLTAVLLERRRDGRSTA
jgi:DNA-binding NarL/FixJ family response regulator